MTSLQMKNKLIRSIQSVENPVILEDLYRLLHLEVEDMKKLEVPEHIKKSIRKGQKDIKEGRYFTNKQVNAEFDQWLKK